MRMAPLRSVIGKSGIFVDGDWVESKDQDPEGGVRLLQLADVGIAKFIDKSNRFMNAATAKRLRCTTLKSGDIMIARMPDPIGRACVFPGSDQPCVTVVDVAIVRPDSEVADTRYLNWVINSPLFQEGVQQHIKGSTRQRISRKNLEAVEIPLPALPEQKRIASILDHADNLRRKRQRAIACIDQLGQAIFHEMFGDLVRNPMGWDTVKLGDLCTVGSSKRVFVEEFVDGGIPFYRGTEVGKLAEGEVIQPDLFIAPNHYEELIGHSGKPEIGDLLLPSICHDGRIWRVDNEKPFYFKDGRVLWIKRNVSVIDSEYLRNHLRNAFLNNYASIASGTTFAELKIVHLKGLQILLPPLELQMAFSNRIRDVKACRETLLDAEADCASLFQSLQNQAFKGEL